MKTNVITLFIILICMPMFAQIDNLTQKKKSKIAIAIHGGASNIVKLHLTREQDSAYRKNLDEALNIGYTILK